MNVMIYRLVERCDELVFKTTLMNRRLEGFFHTSRFRPHITSTWRIHLINIRRMRSSEPSEEAYHVEQPQYLLRAAHLQPARRSRSPACWI